MMDQKVFVNMESRCVIRVVGEMVEKRLYDRGDCVDDWFEKTFLPPDNEGIWVFKCAGPGMQGMRVNIGLNVIAGWHRPSDEELRELHLATVTHASLLKRIEKQD